MKWFLDTECWRVLKPKNETVDEPNKATFKNPRAHTITEEDAKLLTGNRRKYKVNRRGDVIKDNSGKGLFDT